MKTGAETLADVVTRMIVQLETNAIRTFPVTETDEYTGATEYVDECIRYIREQNSAMEKFLETQKDEYEPWIRMVLACRSDPPARAERLMLLLAGET